MAASLRPISPLLPMPVTTTRPAQPRISSRARSKSAAMGPAMRSARRRSASASMRTTFSPVVIWRSAGLRNVAALALSIVSVRVTAGYRTMWGWQDSGGQDSGGLGRLCWAWPAGVAAQTNEGARFVPGSQELGLWSGYSPDSMTGIGKALDRQVLRTGRTVHGDDPGRAAGGVEVGLRGGSGGAAERADRILLQPEASC